VTEDKQDQLYIMGKALIHESIAYNKLSQWPKKYLADRQG